MAWTKEQESAINARGCSLLVSAAAGSGKTSVLVERLIRILSDSDNRVPADRMIVVTFTKDAAAEMKQRLTAALADLIDKEPDNQWLNEQQLLLQSAKISTIHSFCFDLIRDNIQELELTGSFRIMDETESDVLYRKTISEVITGRFKTDRMMMEYLYNQFCLKDDGPLEEITGSIYEFISSLPYGISWLEKVCENYSPSGNAYDDFMNRYMRYVTSDFNRALVLSEECVNLAAEGEIGDKAEDILNTEFDTIRKMKEVYVSEGMDPEDVAASYAAPSFSVLRTGKNAVPEIKDKIKSLRDEYKEILNKSLPKKLEIIAYAREDTAAHHAVLSSLLSIIRELDEKLWKKKVEKSCIGFADAESLAVKLLAVRDDDGTLHKSELAQSLSEYYSIIMIDEFQDTNNNQDLIFRMLSKGGTAERAGNNLFMVGDVKQSIYRFRLANPKNFISTMDSSEEYTEENSGQNAFIRLNRNFRSSADVINLVNFVFSSVMSREVGEIVYDSGEELVQGASFSERCRKTEAALIYTDEENAVTQAEYTAEKIASMLKNGVTVDNKNGGTRPCTKRDFCILLRGRSKASEYIAELAKRGITAYSEENAGYLSSREISVLINLLRITDNPLIDTAFASVLMSPLFMFTDDDMIRLRLENRRAHLYSAVCAIADGENTEPVSDEMKAKILHIRDTVSELRMRAAAMSLVELIQYIYDRTDFISLVHMYEDGAKKRANLRALLEYARSYQDASDDGLNGFIRYIDRTLKINGDFKQGQSVSGSEDVVSIKTIHKSKGLEYPFVFLCESESQFNRQDSLKKYQFNFESGIGFRLQNRREFKKFSTMPFEVINMMNSSDSVSEEMRLLYVALTRAREQLFIPLEIGASQLKKLSVYAQKIKQAEGISSDITAGANSMEDWLLMAFLTHRNGNKLRELSGYDMFWIQKTEFDIDFTEIRKPDDAAEECEETAEKIMPDPEISEVIRKKFAGQYQYADSTIQAKFSVSDISKDHSIFGNVLKRPAFMKEQTGMTPTERGTVIHSILQHADFEKLLSDPQGEIRRAAGNGFITEKQAEETDLQYIRAFTESEIFRRAVASPRVERERKFLVRISDLELENEEFRKYSDTDSMVQGIADMYFEEEDGLVLVDYKTDNVSDISKLAENYRTQLEIYRAAVESMENKKVKQTVIYSLKLGEYTEVKGKR